MVLLLLLLLVLLVIVVVVLLHLVSRKRLLQVQRQLLTQAQVCKLLLQPLDSGSTGKTGAAAAVAVPVVRVQVGLTVGVLGRRAAAATRSRGAGRRGGSGVMAEGEDGR